MAKNACIIFWLSAKRIDNVKNVDQYIDRIDEMIARKKEYFDKL